MVRPSKIRKRIEVKYTQPVKTVSTFRRGGSDTSVPGNTRWNLWQSFMPRSLYSGVVGRAPQVLGSGRWTEFADNISFEESVFTPGPHNAAHISSENAGIAQGTGTHQRIGREINVIKDKWRFKITIPNKDLAGESHPARLGGRSYKIRMLCIYRHKINPTEMIYLDPTQIFDDPYNRVSTFKADVSGYTVVFDKTISIGGQPATNTVTNASWKDLPHGYFTNGSTGALTVYVKFSASPYVLSWADENSTGRFQPYTQYDQEVVDHKYNGSVAAYTYTEASPGTILTSGVTQGVFQWFYYLEDLHGDTLGAVYPAATNEPADPREGKYVVASPYFGAQFDIERVTKYTDA